MTDRSERTAPDPPAPPALDPSTLDPAVRRRRGLVLELLQRSGVFSLIGLTGWRRRRLCILMFHGISIDDEDRWNPDLYLSVERYRAALQTVKDTGCSVLPLAEGVERLRAGTLPPRAVSLTFDDGNYDFAARAVPVLQDFGFPATVFVATYYAEHARPVFNPTLSYVLWKAEGRSADPGGVAHGAEPLATDTLQARRRSWARIFDRARAQEMSGLDKHELLLEVADRMEVDMVSVLEQRLFQLMRPEELAALPGDSIDVQLHTHRHRTPRDRELFSREILDNRESLRRALGNDRPLDQFCYPSGDYVPDYVPWLRELGVRIGVTCDNGLATADSSELLLPRFAVTSAASGVFLRALLLGLPDLLGRAGPRNLRAQEVPQDPARIGSAGSSSATG